MRFKQSLRIINRIISLHVSMLVFSKYQYLKWRCFAVLARPSYLGIIGNAVRFLKADSPGYQKRIYFLSTTLHASKYFPATIDISLDLPSPRVDLTESGSNQGTLTGPSGADRIVYVQDKVPGLLNLHVL